MSGNSMSGNPNMSSTMSVLNMMGNGSWKTVIIVAVVAFLGYLIYQRWYSPKPSCCDGKENLKIVLFYQDGCPPCEELKPVWNQLVDMFEKENVEFSKVDLAKKKVEGITHTPTILVHKNSQTLRYNGPRNLPEMTKYLRGLLG